MNPAPAGPWALALLLLAAPILYFFLRRPPPRPYLVSSLLLARALGARAASKRLPWQELLSLLLFLGALLIGTLALSGLVEQRPPRNIVVLAREPRPEVDRKNLQNAAFLLKDLPLDTLLVELPLTGPPVQRASHRAAALDLLSQGLPPTFSEILDDLSVDSWNTLWGQLCSGTPVPELYWIGPGGPPGEPACILLSSPSPTRVELTGLAVRTAPNEIELVWEAEGTGSTTLSISLSPLAGAPTTKPSQGIGELSVNLAETSQGLVRIPYPDSPTRALVSIDPNLPPYEIELPSLPPVRVGLVSETPSELARFLRLHPRVQLWEATSSGPFPNAPLDLLILESPPLLPPPDAAWLFTVGIDPQPYGGAFAGPTQAPGAVLLGQPDPLLTLLAPPTAAPGDPLARLHVTTFRPLRAETGEKVLLQTPRGPLLVRAHDPRGERLHLGTQLKGTDLLARVEFLHLLTNLLETAAPEPLPRELPGLARGANIPRTEPQTLQITWHLYASLLAFFLILAESIMLWRRRMT
jgi:hypothetical protein